MRPIHLLLVLFLALALPGCEAIVSIFQAGMWVGVLGVLIVIGIIALIVSKAR